MLSGFAFATNETAAHKMPSVEFNSVSREALREAKEWTTNMLKPSDIMTIKNNHVIYLGQDDHAYLLSLQTMLNVRIEEFFRKGKGGITITGNPSNVSCAAIEVESMLCRAQEEFARAEERDMLYSVVRWSCKDSLNNSFYSRTPETRIDYVGKDLRKAFDVVKVRKYGSGIYFSSTVDGAMELWKDQEHEQYIYIIQAQVITGKFTIGSPHLILPPSLHGDPLDRYDSLSDMMQTHVIFNGQQALPEYLIIYTRSSHVMAGS
uniref:PARP catalytic domain-containing protein n=1 Tax=Cyprinus carpio TaxID=7962 RepID=A0A8C1KL35_CYPCA